MSSLAHAAKPIALRVLAVLAGAMLILTTALVDVAQAHGSIIDPASRNYSCWKRWGSQFQNPAMATQDPMCWQAWRADPSAMWNWNGLYVDGIGGAYESAIPDGQICSAGRTGGMRYAALDTPGEWTTTNIGTNFTVRLHDQARHGADFIRIYVSRQGYNATTTPLKWSDLERVTTTGRVLPGVGETTTDPILNGVTVSANASAPGRTGRHVVFTMWKASHSDQTYYFCSDVNFGGTGNVTTAPTTPVTTRPTTPPTSRATTPPTTRPTLPPSTPATTAVTTPATTGNNNPTGGCTATYRVTGNWSGGFQAEVAVANTGTTPTTGWTVNWTFANGQSISQIWGGVSAPSGTTQAVRNVSWNGVVQPNASTTFGFIGSGSGASVPTGVTCTRA